MRDAPSFFDFSTAYLKKLSKFYEIFCKCLLRNETPFRAHLVRAFVDGKKLRNFSEIMRIYILYYLLSINVIAFLIYGIDKLKAKKGKWRISEATLLLLAILGGSIGALLGIKVWHHKGKLLPYC